MFSALAARFPNAYLGFGECGWGLGAPRDFATRAALYQRFYEYRCPAVPAFMGGCFFWEFRQLMVPDTTDDYKELVRIMLGADVNRTFEDNG
jgi:hypothetical protein